MFGVEHRTTQEQQYFQFRLQTAPDITNLQPLVDNSSRPTKGIRILTFEIIEVRNIPFDTHLTDFGNNKIHLKHRLLCSIMYHFLFSKFGYGHTAIF